MTLVRPYRLLENFHPKACVAVGDGKSVYAPELWRDIQAVARALPECPGTEVLVVCRDRYLFAVAVLATWVRSLQVALPPNLQPDVVDAFGRRPAVVAVLHDGFCFADQAHVPANACDVRPWLSDDATETGEMPRGLTIASDQLLATVYTSGSTGSHQACPKIARQLIGEAMVLAEHFRVLPGDRLLATVPPHHIYGLLFGTLVPLVAGACFVRETPFHAETVAAAARRHRADMLVSVPAHLRSFVMLDPGPFARLRRVFSSGAPLPRRVASEVAARHGVEVTEVYGSSETGGIAWRIQRGEDTPWAPLPGVRVDRDADGCLRVASPFLPVDHPESMRCLDRIELVGRDRFVLRGRIDNVVKIGSKRIALAELEQRLVALPEVADAAIAAVEVGGARGQQIVAAVVPAVHIEQPASWVRELKRKLAQWFDPVVLPRQIRVVQSLPREANGKLTRHRLLSLFDNRDRSVTSEFAFHSHTVQTRGSTEVHEYAVTVPHNLVYFNGHFDGHPVLPGVSQMIGMVLRQVGSFAPGFGAPRRLQKLKFRRQIRPGDALTLELKVFRGNLRVEFLVTRAGEPCTSGTVEFNPARGANG